LATQACFRARCHEESGRESLQRASKDIFDELYLFQMKNEMV